MVVLGVVRGVVRGHEALLHGQAEFGVNEEKGKAMRSLVLVLAAFAAGTLLGWMLAGDPAASRASARTPSAGTETTTRVPAPVPDPAPASRPEEPLPPDVRSLVERAHVAAVGTGTGRITGTVLDDTGAPVAGAVFTAIPLGHPQAPQRRTRGWEPGKDHSLEEVALDAVEAELWQRQTRCQATSGPDGTYAIKGLLGCAYRLFAHHPGFELSPRAQVHQVMPGSSVDWLGRAVIEIPVEVVAPDGGPATSAYVYWKLGEGSRGGVGWGPTDKSVRVPRQATALFAQAMTDASVRSAEVEIHPVPGEAHPPVVLRMEGRPGLRVVVQPPTGFLLPWIEVRARLLAPGEVPDPSTMESSTLSNHAVPMQGMRAEWFDIEPGRYLVAARWSNRVLAHTVVEVGSTVAEATLAVPPPDPSKHLLVQVLGPGDAPVTGNVSLSRSRKGEHESRSGGVQALHRSDGTFFVPLDDPDYPNDGNHSLCVIGHEFGQFETSFDPQDPMPIVVRFKEPATVDVRVRGYVGSGLEGKLQAALGGLHGGRENKVVEGGVARDLGPVQPGDSELSLLVREGQYSWVVAREPIRLESGANEASIAVPTLHTVVVRCPGAEAGARVLLRPRDLSTGYFHLQHPLDADKTTTFEHLPPGTYQLSCNRWRTEIEVPKIGSVTLD